MIKIRILESFHRLYKNIQHKNSRRANSIFTSDVFAIVFIYLSILELKETKNESPTQTSRHLTVKQEICLFSNFQIQSVKTLLVTKSHKISKMIYKEY